MPFNVVQGLAWIEVKAYEPFDLDSTQWLGNPGHFKGDSPLLGALLQQGAEAAHLLLIVFGSPFWQPNLLDSTGHIWEP